MFAPFKVKLYKTIGIYEEKDKEEEGEENETKKKRKRQKNRSMKKKKKKVNGSKYKRINNFKI